MRGKGKEKKGKIKGRGREGRREGKGGNPSRVG